MRAPLSSIITIMDILLGMIGKPTNVKAQRKYYKQVKSSANLLMNFVQDLLDMRQITQNKFVRKLCSFDPNRLIRQVLKIFSDQAKCQKVTLNSYVCYSLPSPYDNDD